MPFNKLLLRKMYKLPVLYADYFKMNELKRKPINRIQSLIFTARCFGYFSVLKV